MNSTLQFRSMLPADWNQVATIYKEGIETGHATFETIVPTWEQWNQVHIASCRIVAVKGNEVIAWAALSPISSRCVYGGVGEVSVYVGKAFSGQKIGLGLLERLVKASEDAGIWTLQAGVFPENKASIKIHENCGFRQVGYREKIGKQYGVWRDTVLLERRSSEVGVE